MVEDIFRYRLATFEKVFGQCQAGKDLSKLSDKLRYKFEDADDYGYSMEDFVNKKLGLTCYTLYTLVSCQGLDLVVEDVEGSSQSLNRVMYGSGIACESISYR